ncbi:MAG: hypothetical protein ACLGI6_17235 [Gammaproteobacteria bacterium]
MKSVSLPAVLLRAQLSLAAFGALRIGALLVCLAGGLTLVWLQARTEQLVARHATAMEMVASPPPPVVSAPVLANQNLTLFYTSLGERRYAEEQVRTLFALATKAGLSLSQGEYKSGRDAPARVATYQITLPVKGSYRAIWQFAMLALRSIPFASLDEISFKRDTVGESNVEARLRFTLYLSEVRS